ncbi:MAG: hydroxymethylbilane synthase [Chloroflexota bacterium]|nr:hydroxymethylbilane synthase [Chloroflexota bacterium]MDE2941001.1 hydroxymethylbilane synthase [Chloroflexota bacterium]MDE3268232.1 hydroxymethylbilane synthase [Chloroflexota bacterium]
MKFAVGTRGSRLALAQTEEVLSHLRRASPGIEASVVVIRSTGDEMPDAPLAGLGKGVFTGALESAVQDGSIDMAVHSLKDLPTATPDSLTVVAVCPRSDPRDVLVNASGCTLAEMPAGAVIGTSSPRRTAQLRALRSDLRVEPVRGNVETRIGRADGIGYEGVVVAAAGLLRLGLGSRIAQHFDPYDMVPEPGQGALAVEVRSDREDLLRLLEAIRDTSTHAAVAAERAFVEAMGGGCRVPIAAHAAVEGDAIAMIGMVSSVDGSEMIKTRLTLESGEPEAAGRALAGELFAMGAAEILASGEEV